MTAKGAVARNIWRRSVGDVGRQLSEAGCRRWRRSANQTLEVDAQRIRSLEAATEAPPGSDPLQLTQVRQQVRTRRRPFEFLTRLSP